jgi:hypothetical protein
MKNRQLVKLRTSDLWDWDRDRGWRAAVKLAETHQKLCAESIVGEISDRPMEPNVEGGT